MSLTASIICCILVAALWLITIAREIAEQRRQTEPVELGGEEWVPEHVKKIRIAIFWRLISVSRDLGIPVRILEPGEMKAAGKYIWEERRGVAHRPVEIVLDRGFVHYTVLAHELGHHIAITRRRDYSELAADEEGIRLVRSVLSDEEREIMDPALDAVLAFCRKKTA
jgi:hypothetical protein